jgi:hypothetical protein
MKLTLTPTSEFETVEGCPCRVWTGETETGTPVRAWVRMVSPQTHDAEANEQFARELKELPKFRKELVSFDLRMVL